METPVLTSFHPTTIIINAFSVAANVFSVCGLVDILIRFGIETACLYGNTSSAFRDIDGILNSLKTLTEILTLIRISVQQYEQSPFAKDDGRQLPPQLHEALLKCKHSLAEIRLLADASSPRTDQGWVVQRFRAIQWAMRNERVKEHCTKIEEHKASLTLFLSFIGR